MLRERIKAGITAKARGRYADHSVRRSRDPASQQRLAVARESKRIGLLPHLDEWPSVVQRLRPAQNWEKVTAAVNAALPAKHIYLIEKRLTDDLARPGMIFGLIPFEEYYLDSPRLKRVFMAIGSDLRVGALRRFF